MSSTPPATSRAPSWCLALALLAWAAMPARAQPAHSVKSRPPAALELVPWFSLDPAGAGLIRTPGSLDLATRQQDDENIIVYGRHKAVDPRSDREHDFSAPGWSEIAIPRDIPIGPPSSCSSGAYRTIGGQPATGQDLVGGLGGGRC